MCIAGRVVGVVCLMVLFLSCGPGCSKKDGSGGPTPALQLAEAINLKRKSLGKEVLIWDAAIAQVEQEHAQWLSEQPPEPFFIPYQELGKDGELFANRLDRVGVVRSEEKEYGFADQSLTNYGLIMDQLPDDHDILDARWDKFGIGYVRPPYREPGRHYWVIGLVNN